MERISFLYVSQIFPGKIARSLNYPQPWIKPDEQSGKISIDVSFGLIIRTKVNYRVDVDLFYGDQRVEFGSNQSLQTDPIVAGTTSGNESVSIENMSIMNIHAENEGVYRVTLSLHVVDDNESSRMIHNSECFFLFIKRMEALTCHDQLLLCEKLKLPTKNTACIIRTMVMVAVTAVEAA
ncbi:hypothetical protein SEEH1023_19269 [Salmonella enterica subsp. enterica serovar Heidelberg str. 670102-3]|nr:hypothetical protein SEEH1023_19269 [Salmonella enterica subsp. enterica serovar Heidelberg str. 670102-3]